MSISAQIYLAWGTEVIQVTGRTLCLLLAYTQTRSGTEKHLKGGRSSYPWWPPSSLSAFSCSPSAFYLQRPLQVKACATGMQLTEHSFLGLHLCILTFQLQHLLLSGKSPQYFLTQMPVREDGTSLLYLFTSHHATSYCHSLWCLPSGQVPNPLLVGDWEVGTTSCDIWLPL